MAATTTADKLGSRSERRMVDFDPNVDTAAIVDLDPTTAGELLPLAHFRRFMAGYFKSVGTGNADAFEIIAATDVEGTGATVVVACAAPTSNNAVGDTQWLECTIEQVREVLATATHIGVRIELATATDEGVVFFERAEPEFPRAGLTADYIA